MVPVIRGSRINHQSHCFGRKLNDLLDDGAWGTVSLCFAFFCNVCPVIHSGDIYIYIIHYLPIGQSQTWICPMWSSNISYISFAKSCIGQLRTTVQYRIYWTVSKRGYGTLRTWYWRTKAVSMYLMKILSIFLHLRKILICFRIGLIFIVNYIFNIGCLTVQYRLYWTQISYIGLGCASFNIAFFFQYNLY